MKFKDQELVFVETTNVQQGVVCDVYQFKNDDTKDLGIIKIRARYQSPKQKVLKGDKTLQIFKEGKGSLEILRKNGVVEVYNYPGSVESVEVNVGDIMQWTAEGDLVFYEVCYPPYTEGRFQDINTDE